MRAHLERVPGEVAGPPAASPRFGASRTDRLLTIVQSALLVTGAALGGNWVIHHAETWLLEAKHMGRFSDAASAPAVAPPVVSPIRGSTLGRIDIPDVGVRALVLAGTDKAQLARGAGHVSGTALPGQPGNVALAGHRDTHFRGLRDIRLGHVVRLTTERGVQEYRVTGTSIVAPSDTSALQASEANVLTLITCHPFGFVGPAPNRFVVRAVAVDA